MQQATHRAAAERPKATTVFEYSNRLVMVCERIHKVDGVIDNAAAAELDALAGSLDPEARAKGDRDVEGRISGLALQEEARGRQGFANAARYRLMAAGFKGLSSPRFRQAHFDHLYLLRAIDAVLKCVEGAELGPASVALPLTELEALRAAREAVRG